MTIRARFPTYLGRLTLSHRWPILLTAVTLREVWPGQEHDSVKFKVTKAAHRCTLNDANACTTMLCCLGFFPWCVIVNWRVSQGREG